MKKLKEVKDLYKKFTAAMSDFNIERRKLQKEVKEFLNSEAEKFFKWRQIKLDRYDVFLVNFDGGCMTFEWEPDAFISDICTGDGNSWTSYQARKDKTWTKTTMRDDYKFKYEVVKSGPCLVSELEDFCKHLSETLGINVYVHYDEKDVSALNKQEEKNGVSDESEGFF